MRTREDSIESCQGGTHVLREVPGYDLKECSCKRVRISRRDAFEAIQIGVAKLIPKNLSPEELPP